MNSVTHANLWMVIVNVLQRGVCAKNIYWKSPVLLHAAVNSKTNAYLPPLCFILHQSTHFPSFTLCSINYMWMSTFAMPWCKQNTSRLQSKSENNTRENECTGLLKRKWNMPFHLWCSLYLRKYYLNEPSIVHFSVFHAQTQTTWICHCLSGVLSPLRMAACVAVLEFNDYSGYTMLTTLGTHYDI